MLIDYQSVEASKIKGRYFGRQLEKWTSTLMEMMEEEDIVQSYFFLFGARFQNLITL